MDRARQRAVARLPGNWPIQRPVHFPDSGAVAESLKTFAITERQLLSSDAKQLPRRDIAKDNLGFSKFIERLNRSIGRDDATQRSQVRGKSVGEALRAAFCNRPSHRMS